MFGQLRGARACFWGIGKLWLITFTSIRAFLCKGVFGALIALVLFPLAFVLNFAASIVGLALALIIGFFEVIFAILIRQ